MRIRILPLPEERAGQMASTPYAVIIDRAEAMTPEAAEQFKAKTGARFVVCDPGEIELG